MVATVDPDDDSLLRHVVRHFRYDPARHERRHVTMCAYTTLSEFEAAFNQLVADLDERRTLSKEVDPQEYISGVTLEAGHRTLQANGRLVGRMFARNAYNAEFVAALELPPNVGIVTAGFDDSDEAGTDRCQTDLPGGTIERQ